MPIFASPEPAPVPDDIATLRRLIGPDARTDEVLTPYLERNRCTVVDEVTGEESTTPDHYGAAAEIWEERAYAAAASAEGRSLTSRRHGDAAETFAEGSGAKGMFAIARRLRRRSCNWKGAATVAVAPPSTFDSERLERLDDADYPRSLQTTEPYDRAVMVNAAEPAD